MNNFGDYLIFVDESGDHNLGASINSTFPVFILMFLVIKKSEYVHSVVPAFQSLKLKYWGHDQVVFHERDIRRKVGAFKIFEKSPNVEESFLQEIEVLLSKLNYALFPVVIDKLKHQERYISPEHPYHLALEFGMERIHRFLINHQQINKTITTIFESRGKVEDKELKLAFLELSKKKGRYADFQSLDYQCLFADKKSNSTGLQMADLMARPYGLSYLRPEQNNKAVETFKTKIHIAKHFP